MGYITVNSALHLSGVAESSTTFDWTGYRRECHDATYAVWQVILCQSVLSHMAREFLSLPYYS